MNISKLIINLVVIIQFFITLPFVKSVEDSDRLLSRLKNVAENVSPATFEYDKLLRKSRQSNCIRCYGNRYLDDDRGGYYNYRPPHNYASSTEQSGRNDGGRYGGRYDGGRYDSGRYDGSRYDGSRYDGSRYDGSRYDERYSSSWHYYPDRYEGYSGQAKYDRYPDPYRSRYDDRYSPRGYDNYNSPHNYYDNYNSKPPVDSRGYGYRNRDRYYEQSPPRAGEGYLPRDRFYDRFRGEYSGRDNYYDRDQYDRYLNRGSGGGNIGYDYKNYRPWDETYRGTSGFDNSGRGYYFASKPDEQLTPSNYRPGSGQPYLPHSKIPSQSVQSYSPYSPNNYNNNIPPPPSSSSSSSQTSSHSTPTGPSSYYHYQQNYNNNRPPRPIDDSSKGYAGGWSYANNRDKTPIHDDKNKDIQNPQYGIRPRPIGGSYLHDRDSNLPSSHPTDNTDDKKQQPTNIKDSESQNSDSGQKSNTINDDNTKH